LPYGKPEWVDANNINPSEFFGFVDVKVKSVDLSKKPLHAIKEDGKLLFRHFKEWTSLTLFSEELKMGIESGIYEYEIQSGLKFDSGAWMEKFFTDAFNKKAAASKIGNEAMTQIYKIIANSGYGFWGLRVKDKDCVKIQRKDRSPIYNYLHTNKLLNYREVGDYSITRVIEDLPITDFNVGVASAISSYSRMKLWSLINDIEKKGGQVYMCDTDSVITNFKLNDHDDMMQKYMWDGCGEDLGSLKNEADDFINKYEKKALVSKEDSQLGLIKQAEDGMISFDELILGGCKFYALRKNATSLCKEITIAKCKGYKKSKGDSFTFEDFEQLSKGGIKKHRLFHCPQEDKFGYEYIKGKDLSEGGFKTQKQVQFRCPKQNHVGDGYDFAMTTPKVEKKFGFSYTKGKISSTGSITPFFY